MSAEDAVALLAASALLVYLFRVLLRAGQGR